MDSRESPESQQQPGVMVSPLHSYSPNSAANPMMFQFNSVSASQPLDSFNSSFGDGSGLRTGGIEPAKKKRGRPRKYSPDGNIALGLSPAPVNYLSSVDHGGSKEGNPASDSTEKRNRGRPAGSGKKQLNALGSSGVGFTPHVILIKTGEDVQSKIMAFSQQGPRTVCVLSANGVIGNVTLRQPTSSGGTVTYEGRFEIISLSGSFSLSESNGNRSRAGGLSVSLAGSDGRVLGGVVVGMLMAATPVQVIVGSFVAEGKKSKSGPPSAPPLNMLNFGVPAAAASPPSQEASSESSDENGSSPLNGGSGLYNNASQSIHHTPMYSNMSWANPTVKMLPN